MIRSGQHVQEFGPFSRDCSEHWKNMSEEEKMPFVLLSNKDRARYQREMEVYSAPESDSDEEGGPRRKKKKKKKVKDPNTANHVPDDITLNQLQLLTDVNHMFQLYISTLLF